ncbi:MAG: hypothetical protein FJ314_02310 [SAR202 cluster bacterium]|nr:hypothetical protein [SAR202 cluster bacterium]
MLGLLNEWPGLGLTAPGKLGVDAHDLAEAVEQAFKPGATSVQGTPGLSPERRKALAGAAPNRPAGSRHPGPVRSTRCFCPCARVTLFRRGRHGTRGTTEVGRTRPAGCTRSAEIWNGVHHSGGRSRAATGAPVTAPYLALGAAATLESSHSGTSAGPLRRPCRSGPSWFLTCSG